MDVPSIHLNSEQVHPARALTHMVVPLYSCCPLQPAGADPVHGEESVEQQHQAARQKEEQEQPRPSPSPRPVSPVLDGQSVAMETGEASGSGAAAGGDAALDETADLGKQVAPPSSLSSSSTSQSGFSGHLQSVSVSVAPSMWMTPTMDLFSAG